MAKALKTIGIVAGAVALVATAGAAIGIALGGTMVLSGVGSAASIALVAGAVAGVAQTGATLLTKPPPARGSVTETLIAVDPPSPYPMGEGYFGGVMRHRVGYGPTIKDVPNPYLFEAVALAVAGPIAGPIAPQVDFGPIPTWYNGFLETDTKLGAVPETALTPPFDPAAPGWSTAHRLSGVAQIGWGHKFDPDGERFSSGLPTRGAYAKWVRVYDPRKDDTQPGGEGAHRLDDETTWEWSENPALHAGTYAYGRHHPTTGRRIFGMGLPREGIDWEGVAAWANDCEANNWSMFGVIYEPDDRWQNLTDICVAGGGQPLFAGAVLGFHWSRPRVALDTVTVDDLADAAQEVTAMQSLRERLNTVRPRFIQPAQNWSLLPGDEVQVASYLAEDGEERAEDVPFNFVKDEDQAAQLAAYWLTNARELTPITLVVKPRLRRYRPGEALKLDLPHLGLDHDAVILRRKLDPATMTVTLTLVTEDPNKHAFALGETGTAPLTPAIGQTAEERDRVAARANEPSGYAQARVRTVSFRNPRDASDVSRQLVLASEASSVVTISIAKFDADYIGAESDVTFDVEEITTLNDGTTPLGFETLYYPYMDYNPLTGDPPTYGIATDALGAQNSADHPLRHAFGRVETPADGSGGTSGGSTGTGGGGGIPPDDTFQ